MIKAIEAADKAKKHLLELMNGKGPLYNLLLEGIELSEDDDLDEEAWQVTLGFDVKDERPPEQFLSDVLVPRPRKDYQRYFRILYIHPDSGDLLRMKRGA